MKNYEMIEIFNQEVNIDENKYNYIIREKWITGFRRKPKFYTIMKNGEAILHTTLHQTFYAEKRKLLGK